VFGDGQVELVFYTDADPSVLANDAAIHELPSQALNRNTSIPCPAGDIPVVLDAYMRLRV
jgi:hypothetical protein